MSSESNSHNLKNDYIQRVLYFENKKNTPWANVRKTGTGVNLTSVGGVSTCVSLWQAFSFIRRFYFCLGFCYVVSSFGESSF